MKLTIHLDGTVEAEVENPLDAVALVRELQGWNTPVPEELHISEADPDILVYPTKVVEAKAKVKAKTNGLPRRLAETQQTLARYDSEAGLTTDEVADYLAISSNTARARLLQLLNRNAAWRPSRGHYRALSDVKR